MAFYNGPWMHNWFDALDLSGIPRYCNQLHGNDWKKDGWEKHFSKFHGHKDPIDRHVISFIWVIS